MTRSNRTYLSGNWSPPLSQDKPPSPKDDSPLIGPPVKGVNRRKKRTEIGKDESPFCRNARLNRDWIEPRPGLTLLKAGFDGTIVGIFQFTPSTGEVYHVVFTEKSLYYSTDLVTFIRIGWYYTTDNATIHGGDPTIVHGTSITDASGTLTSDTNIPHDSDTVTIDTKVYTFKTALTPTEGEVLIGGSAAIALDNLASAINHTGAPDTDYKCAAIHPTVEATTNTDTTQLVVARTGGVAGNSIVTTAGGAGAHLSWGHAHLLGGLDGTAWATNAHVGDHFKLDSVGTYGTILTVDSNIQLTLTASYTAGASESYTIDRHFSGATTDLFWAVTGVDLDYFMFSQGIDTTLYITTAFASGMLPTGAPGAKYGMLYANRLHVFNIPSYSYRHKWSVRGNYLDWSGVGSGTQDWTDEPGEVRGCSVLSDIGIVYKESSIHHIEQTGVAASPFSFRRNVSGIGLLAGHSLRTLRGKEKDLFSSRDKDIFVGSDNIYTYDAYAPTSIGDQVKDDFFSIVNLSYLTSIHSIVVDAFDEYQLFFSSEDTLPSRWWVYNYKVGAWIPEWSLTSTTSYISSSGELTSESSETWDTAVGIWDTDAITWDDRLGKTYAPLYILGIGSSIYQEDINVLDDFGTDFSFEWQLPDTLNYLLKEVTIYRVIVDYYGLTSADLIVSLSQDGGNLWNTTVTKSIEATTGLKRAFFDFLYTGEVVSVKLSCLTGGRFRLVRVKLELTPVGEVIA